MAKTSKINWTDRMISYLAPRWALKRHGARMLLNTLSDNGKKGFIENQRAFEGISHSRIRHDWISTTQDADAANVSSLSELRNTLRNLNQNTGIISGPLKRITNYVIGTGLRPQSKARYDSELESKYVSQTLTEDMAQRFNYQIERAWRNWIDKADAQLRLNFYELQALAFRSFFADGEVLVVARSSDKYGRIVPLCIEVIEIDRLETPQAEISNPKIRNGIEFDEEGVPFRYYVLKRHPGANYLLPKSQWDMEEISAFSSSGQRKVFHLYNILRPGQSRGYPCLASALEDIQDRKRYREAEIVAARVAACLAAFVESPTALTDLTSKPVNSQSQSLEAFEPGMIKYLMPGEKVTIANPGNRPNSQLVEFIQHIDREIANAADFPYEILSGNFGELNYSNARTILILAYIAVRAFQQQFVDHLCYPVWELFATDCVISGLVDAPGFRDRTRDYCNSQWIPPKRDWIDPSAESAAAKTDLETNVTTLSDLITAKGGDWEEHLEQRARELQKIKELEDKYGITFSQEKGIFTGQEGKA